LMKSSVPLANDFTSEFLIFPISGLVRKARFGHASYQLANSPLGTEKGRIHVIRPEVCVSG
jgi:hypothetical protein